MVFRSTRVMSKAMDPPAQRERANYSLSESNGLAGCTYDGSDGSRDFVSTYLLPLVDLLDA